MAVLMDNNSTIFNLQAYQGEEEKKRIEGDASGEMELKANNKKEFVLCWQKLDRKSKKVNFLISQTNQHYEDKATASTIDEVGG